MSRPLADRLFDPWRNTDRDDEQTRRQVRALVFIAWLILTVLTAALWLPSTLFPLVPLVGVGQFVPRIAQSMVTAAFCFLLFTGARTSASPIIDRRKLWTLWGCCVFLLLCDQHRLQPWAYQFFLLASLIVACPPYRALPLARLLTVGLYAWSAVSKLDYSFLDTHGQTLLSGLIHSVGFSDLSDKPWFQPPTPEQARWWLPLMFPMGELFVAIGLSIRRLRRAALIASLVMHALLLLTLGPTGLGHSLGVLAWNVFFIAQNVLLFGPLIGSREKTVANASPDRAAQSLTTPTWTARIAEGLTLAAIALPALEPWGWFDHWPAWALYASRGEHVTVDVQLPEGAEPPVLFISYLDDPAPFEEWRRVDIARWSLDVTNAPITPQERFQIGVALAVADAIPPGSQIRVTLDGVANRWTGKRSRRELIGRNALAAEARTYWLNAFPVPMDR